MSAITEQLQALLSPPLAPKSQERTLEFLNSTYPTFDALNDGDALDKAVEDAENRSRELNQKLELSSTTTAKKITSTLASASTYLQSAKELSLTRHSLVDQLSTLTEELLPSEPGQQRTLLEELEDLHARLNELQNSRNYVAVLDKALELSEQAVTEIQSSKENPVSETSLSKYMELQNYVSTTVDALKPAESVSGEPLKIVAFLRDLRIRTWKDIVGVLSESLLAIAEQLRWPSPISQDLYDSLEAADKSAFENTFVNLLLLQAAGEKINAPTAEANSISALRKQGLYPLQALLEPISMRFRYHFDGKRQTNRLDKPEWYFTHVLNLMHEHKPFMTTNIQPLLGKGGYGDVNAFDEFCRLLFGLLTRKLKRTVPLLLTTPAILAHTVYQTLIFDGSVKDGGFEIRRTWEGKQRLRQAEEERKKAKTTTAREAKRLSKPPYEAAIEWEGLGEVILGRKDWFDAWLQGEKQFADNQYNEIISSPDAWQISDDGDSGDSGAQLSADYGSRATTSARRFKALVERVTERYQPLPHIVQKSHFLFDIQLPLLEAYLSRIAGSLDAYERLSSSFVRAVPGALAGQVGHGVDSKRLTSGVEGLTRVVKALVSARWIKAAMDAWGEDLSFLELWHAIQENPVLRARAEAQTMLPRTGATATLDDQADSTMFDVLVKQYGDVVNRAEDMIDKQICAEVETELKPYFASQYEKTESENVGESNALSIPATLVSPVSLLSSEISFLAQTLPTAEVTGMYRRVATSLATHIIQRSVSHRGKAQFTPAEGQAFKDECATLVETCRMALSRGGAALAKRADLPWQSLTDVAAIVGVPETEFDKVVVAAFDRDDTEFEQAMKEIGVRALSRIDVQNFLRARADFRR
ncbi:hypothetical protein FRC04_002639 [Tulasnella sp. 424]|nr:hypothetical protein FRC04_002639 [Tulasnella sp. 424]KAG8981279.1 hypothetical protein FRC05_004181 [Tulasnella sp. 425]